MRPITRVVKQEKLKEMIDKSRGTIFTVTFIKKNGDERKMNCRKGVKKHLHGGTSTTAKYNNLVTVYDVKALAYRTINIDTATNIKIGGYEYKVI